MTNFGKRRAIASGYLRALLATTALVSPLILAAPAAAVDYTGGTGAQGTNGSFPNTGCVCNSGQPGGAGGGNGFGGGSGATGAANRGYANSSLGGYGGAADAGGGGGAYYATGAGGAGGGAGGAGYLLLDGNTLASGGAITGGNGGYGGYSNVWSDPSGNNYGIDGGGGGGGGGSGVIATGTVSFTNTGTILGGTGGTGAVVNSYNSSYNGYAPSSFGDSGNGGAGGHGVRADSAASLTLNNSGTITGGTSGNHALIPTNNQGGAGVYGQNITLTNTGGTIKGGYGATSGAGVEFTGGVNTLNLIAGAITSDYYGLGILVDNGTNTFNISGGSVSPGSGATYALQINGGTNTLNVTGGSLGSVLLNSGTTTLSGTHFSNSIIVGGGGSVAVAAADTASGITTLDSYGAVTINANGILSVGTFTNENGATLTLGAGATLVSTNLNLVAGSTITGAGSLSSGSAAYSLASGSISAALAGTGGLTKTGSGTLTLTGANTYTGGTNITGGTLAVAFGALGGGDVHMAQGTTIQFTGSSFTTSNNFFINGDPVFNVASGNTQTVNGLIADDTSAAPTVPGVVEKTGAGTLVLSGANTYSGGTDIQAGILQDAATAVFNTANDPTSGIVSSGLGIGSVTLSGGTLQMGISDTLANTVTLNGAGIFDANGKIVTLAGAISGNGTLTFADSATSVSGEVDLTGNNTFSGALTINSGHVTAESAGAIPGGLAVTVNGAGSIYNPGSLDLDGYSVSVASLSGDASGAITNFGGAGGSSAQLTFAPTSGTSNFAGTITDDAAHGRSLALVMNGAGGATQVLSGANAYSGGTTLTSGTLEIANAGALGSGAVAFNGGTLKVDGGYTIANAISVNNGGAFDNNGHAATLAGNITDGGTPGVLTLAGSGSTSLTGDNSGFSGGLSVTAGTLALSGPNSAGSGDIAAHSATVAFDAAGSYANNFKLNTAATFMVSDVSPDHVTLNGVIADLSGSAGLTLTGNTSGATVELAGANTYSGGTTLDGGIIARIGVDTVGTAGHITSGALGTGTVTVTSGSFQAGGDYTLANDIDLSASSAVDANGHAFILSGLISGMGALYLSDTQSGGSIAMANASNSFLSGVIINNVTVILTGSSGTGTGPLGTGPVTLDGGVLRADAPGHLDNLMYLDLHGGTLRASSGTYSFGPIADGGISGHLTIGAAGDTGTVSLADGSTYTGGTTVAAGTALVNGATAFGDITQTVVMQAGTRLAYANTAVVSNPLQWTGNVALNVDTGGAEQHGDISDDSPANAYTVTKTGAGTLLLSGANGSSANLTLAAGTLEIGTFNALGNGTYTFDGGTLRLDGNWTIANDLLVLSGGTLDNGGNAIELSGDVSSDSGVLTLAGTGSVKIANHNNLSGGAAIGAGTTLEVAGASGMGAGDVSMASGSTIKFTTVSSTFTNHFLLDGYSNFDVASGLTTTLSGVIADAPATTGTLVNAGMGTLVLSGANTYSGGTYLSDGILQIGVDTVGTPGSIISSAVGTGTISFYGGTLQAGGDYTVANTISLANGNGTVDANGHAFALTGVISGGHVLTLADSQGGGTIMLSGANTYNGGTVIGSGVTALAGNDQAFGQGTVTLAGGVMGVVAGTTVSPGNAIAVGSAGGTILANGGMLNLSGTISDIDPGNTGWLTLGRTNETGTIAVSGTNTYAGGTIIAGGTVKVSGGSALGAGAVEMGAGAVLAFTSGASLGNMLIVDDTTPMLDVAGGTATLSGGISELSSASGGFTKTGSGTLLLTGGSGNSGRTNVSAGTLEIGDGAAASSSAYQVEQGATLAFDAQSLNYAQIGSLAGAGNVTSATLLEIGNSDNTTFSGVITTAGLTYNGSGILTLTGTGNVLGGIGICSCVTSGGIILFGGSASAYSGVGVESGTLTVTAGAQFTTSLIAQGGGTIAVSGNGTTVDVANAGAGMIGISADGSTVPVFTVSNGAHVTGDILLTGIAGGTAAPQITVTGANALLSLTNGAQLNDGTVLTVADHAILTTASVDLDTNASLVIGAGAAAGTVGDTSTRIQGLSSGTSVVANFTGDATLDALLTGSLALNVQAGNLTLTNVINDYSGGTTIGANGVLILTDSSAGTGAIADSGFLAIDNSSSSTFAYGVTGSGGLAQIGTGALSVNTAQVYTGRTVIGPASTLFLTGAGDLSHSSNIDAEGTFDVSGVTATNVSIQTLDGDGDVEIGNHTLIITGSGGVYSGMLSDGHAGGSLTLLGNQVLNGIISITGTTTLGAGSTLTVSGPDALGGGALDFKAGSTLKFGASGTYTNNMTFEDHAPVFDVTGATVTLPGLLSGPGDLAVTGASGTLILTNTANSYGGGTEVTGGSTLRLDADGELGAVAALQLGDATTGGTLKYAGAFALASGRILTVNAGGGTIDTNGNDVTIASAIGGSGGLTKTGVGNLILTGTSSFTGPTSINAGTLSVNGSIAASAVTVNSGAILGGTGTVGAATVVSGGTLAPGNSIGTLHVNGNLVLASGSTYAAEVSPGTADQVIATGTASLGGTLAISQGAGTYTDGTNLTLISATGVSGTFGSVTGASFAGLNSSIIYSATSVSLKLSSSASGGGGGSPSNSFLFNTYGTTPNQIAAGTALAAGSNAGTLYRAMGGVVSANTAGVSGALGQAAGDIHASMRGAAIEDSRIIRDAVLGRLDQGGEHAAVWGSAFGGYGSIAGDGNAAALHHDSAGIIAGADMPLSDGIRAGIAAAYSTDRASTSGHLSTVSGNNGHIIGYAGWGGGAFDVKLGGDYGWGTAHTARQLTVLGQTLAGRQDQRMGQVFADAGYRIASDVGMFEPYADIAHVEATSGSFAERGGSAALSGGSATDGVTYGTLGARAALTSLESIGITPKIDLGWRHAFDTLKPGQIVSFQDTGTSFTVLGVPLETDAAALQLGFDVTLTSDAKLSLGYDGTFGNRVQNNAVRGAFQWTF